MNFLELEIASHLETINFIVKMSQVDYLQLYNFEREFKFLEMNLYELYKFMKNLEYIKGDNKSQLIATPEQLFKGNAPYQNCAVKVYLFACLLRYLSANNHPLKKYKYYIEISGKTKSFEDIGHIYFKVKLDTDLKYFDFTYPTRNHLFKPLYFPGISIAKEFIL
ncbi:MAG: hypothetical protein IPO06_29585 [Leptospiraceae bacterium]|nr:hypothetical protein [Leptospiraceae bacterium]MBP6738357.1 hypothetical protein [Leptospiraceae bacterium]